MALHKDFPQDPYAILDPQIRWGAVVSKKDQTKVEERENH